MPPFVGEIRIFAGNFPPAGWMFCDGSTLADLKRYIVCIDRHYVRRRWTRDFQYPDLRGRLPVHNGTLAGTTFQIGEQAGSEEVTLTTQQIPVHTHLMQCSSGNQSDTSNPQGNRSPVRHKSVQYSARQRANGNPFHLRAILRRSQPHTNFMPYLCVDSSSRCSEKFRTNDNYFDDHSLASCPYRVELKRIIKGATLWEPHS